MLPQEILRKKRSGEALDEAEIGFLIEGLASGRLSDAQVGAFAMAVAVHGMMRSETVALTRAMTASGARLAWDALDGPVVDKHSTGGVGDKVSLILAPILAACGAYVPMISGRGLGHTGGTLDKLEAIPGYRTQPDLALFRRVVETVGCGIVGQTADLAPADRRLYAIRDVTGTVESLPLIVSSILSKKLAAGLDALVMDVKVGSGAFFADLEMARELADTLVEVADGAGLRCHALLTDMNMCLGRVAGNAHEVGEAIELLSGRKPEARLEEVVLALAGEALALAGLCPDHETGRAQAAKALDSGAAAERFARMVHELGGPTDLLERHPHHLPRAPVERAVPPDRPGFVHRIDVRSLGLAVVALGGGRTHPDHDVDPAVGLADVALEGHEVGHDRPLAIVHARDHGPAEAAEVTLRRAFAIADEPPPARPVVHQRVVRRQTSKSS